MKPTRLNNWSFLPIILLLTALTNLTTSAPATAAEIVCIQCHAKLQGKYGEPVRLWQGSIHAENGIACNSCHGGDPKDEANAMNPARGFLGKPKEADIPAFCGRCHVGVLKDYLSSLHGKALGRGGPTCVTCHENHHVVKASLELINEKNCSRCHSYQQAAKIKGVMARTESRILAIDTGISNFKQQGFDTERLEKGLFAVRNGFHSLFHTVDVAKVEQELARIEPDLIKLENLLADIDNLQRQRKLIGACAVGGALLAALLFHLLRRTFDQTPT